MVAEYRVGLEGHRMCLWDVEETLPVLEASHQDTQSSLYPACIRDLLCHP